MMIWEIYYKLLDDKYIESKAGNNIKFYEYPEAKDVEETHIIIDPLDVPKPDDYADNEWLTEDHLYQIDVWSKDMAERDEIAKRIQRIMWKELSFRQVGGLPEYDSDLDIYRDARRYRSKAYREDFDSL